MAMKTRYTMLTALLMAGLSMQAAPATTLQDVKVTNVKMFKQGNEMRLRFDLDFTGVKLGSEQQVIYTPVFAGENDSILLDKIVLNGRNVMLKEEREPKRRIPGAKTIRRNNKTKQSTTISATMPYAKWMDFSRVYVAEDLCGCGRLKDQASIPVGEFDNRPAPTPMMTFVTPKAEAVKARAEKGSAFVDYVVNRTEIKPDYRNNRREIQKIINTIDLVKNDPNVSITEINIHGYASPEGSYANNTRLAEGRAASLKDYVKSLYTLQDKLFTSKATPEDWGGLRKMVVESTLPEKAEILAIIDNPNLEPDPRNDEIRKRFPKTYQYMLTNWYPALRHSDYTVSYVVRPFTVEETKEMIKKNPKQVSLNEMFIVAQTLEPGSDEFNHYMQIAIDTYPDDETANLNAASAALNRQDWSAAEKYLRKAGNSPEAIHDRGVLALNTGRYDDAEKFLKQAEAAGVAGAADNLKILDRLRTLQKQNKDEE